MAIEMGERINGNQSEQSSTPKITVRSEDRVIDHRVSDRHIKPVTQVKSDQNGTNSTSRAINGAQAETSSVTVESVTLSPAAAALAKKEAKFRQQEAEFKAKSSALEAERAEIAELKALKAKLAAKDFSALEDHIPYNEYTQYLLNKQSSLTPEQQEIQALKAKLDGVEKAQQEDVSKRFEAAVNERRKAVTALVDSDDRFSSIKELKQHEAVVQHILDTWEHDDIDLSPEQAAQEVEDLLVERASMWANLPKIKSKAEPQVEQRTLPPLKPSVKTLTNNMAATGEIKRVNKSFEGMSEQERYAEARRRAEEKLKNRQ